MVELCVKNYHTKVLNFVKTLDISTKNLYKIIMKNQVKKNLYLK